MPAIHYASHFLLFSLYFFDPSCVMISLRFTSSPLSFHIFQSIHLILQAFKPANGDCRMDPATPENAPFFTALFRHMQMCSMLGCPSVAAEVGKLLLSLDPQGDRFNVLLTLDHFLVTAAKHTQLLEFMGLTRTSGNSLLHSTLLFLLLLTASSLIPSLPILCFCLYVLPCPVLPCPMHRCPVLYLPPLPCSLSAYLVITYCCYFTALLSHSLCAAHFSSICILKCLTAL